MGVKPTRKLVLASSSPRRQELVHSLGISCEIDVSDVDESTPSGAKPAEVVTMLALRKARKVHLKRFMKTAGLQSDMPTDEVVLGADTIVCVDGEILGKPKDREDAFRMLSKLQGRGHEVYSGIALIDSSVQETIPNPQALQVTQESGVAFGASASYQILSRSSAMEPTAIVGYSVTRVVFRPLTNAQIYSYIAKGESGDKAGAYAIQNIGAALVERIEGDYFTVVGLPVSLLAAILEQFHIHIL